MQVPRYFKKDLKYSIFSSVFEIGTSLVVSNEVIRPGPGKTRPVAAFRMPTDKKAARRFLGLCVYYRLFVQNFAKLSAPFTHLTKGAGNFVWGEEQQQALDKKKRPPLSPPILGQFDQ